uniref:Gamma-tubulin complex component n=1 Tax=Henneguya salminicola TaxID=69463 RepID=A0A6G3MIT1_HENSL
MLHDTILALLGIPGDLFVKSKDGIHFDVTNTLSKHIHISELQQLSKLAVFGGIYNYIQEFILLFMNADIKPADPSSSDHDITNSLYLESFALGLEEALEPYKNAVQDIENEVLTNEFVTLSYFIVKVEIYAELLNILSNLIHDIYLRKIYGHLVYNYIFGLRHHPNSIVSSSISTIVQKISQVLLNWVSCCTLYGVLHDQFNEFFIGQKVVDKYII